MRPVRDDDRLERPFDYDAALDALDCDDAGEPSPDPPPANAAAWYDAGRCRNTGKRRAVCLCDACASRCAADEQAQSARADASWARNARAEREAELDAIRRAGKPAVSWAAAAEGDDDDGSCYGPRSSVASFGRASSCDSLQYEEEGGDAGEGGGASERGSREAERVVFAVPGPARGGRVSVRDPSDDALDASPPPRMRRALSSSAAEDDIRCFADALSCLTAPLRLLLAAAACLVFRVGVGGVAVAEHGQVRARVLLVLRHEKRKVARPFLRVDVGSSFGGSGRRRRASAAGAAVWDGRP
mmetsp:Transcript_19561/g.64690  ORF Transcript_19561/g.64690 Transcript_19561/m.64690 type:complete len:301 (+) Transcript_19561:91-993(+)